MKRTWLSLLTLLPLVPLSMAGQEDAGLSPASSQPRQREESLGHFFKRLTNAPPKQAAEMVAAMPDINAATPGEGITAMHAAVACGRLDILQLLLQRGARTEQIMKPGITPLAAAAMKNDTNAIAMLLKHGAQLNHHTQGGVSALKLACARGNLDAVQVLLAHGADTIPADADGHTALTLVQEQAGENLEPLMLMLLEHGANPNIIVGEEGTPPLVTAILSRDLPVARMLLRFGAQPNFTRKSGGSALMIAAGYGYAELVNELLERGATVSLEDGDGNNALDHAAFGAQFVHALYCIATEEEFSISPQEAVDTLATCKLLLEHGADVHHTDSWGCTPLMLAARAAHPGNIKLFLEHGADVNAKDKEGHTPLIAALLPPTEKLRLSVTADSEEEFRMLERLCSPLFENLPHTEQAVRLLLEAGADPSVKDATGRSALDYASTPALRALLTEWGK